MKLSRFFSMIKKRSRRSKEKESEAGDLFDQRTYESNEKEGEKTQIFDACTLKRENEYIFFRENALGKRGTRRTR